MQDYLGEERKEVLKVEALVGLMLGFLLLLLNGFVFVYSIITGKSDEKYYIVKLPDYFVNIFAFASIISVGLGGLLIYVNHRGYLEQFSTLVVAFYMISIVMLAVEWVLCSHNIIVYKGSSKIGILDMLGNETLVSFNDIGKVRLIGDIGLLLYDKKGKKILFLNRIDENYMLLYRELSDYLWMSLCK